MSIEGILEEWRSKSWKIRDELEKTIKSEASWLNLADSGLSAGVLAEKAATWIYCSNYLWDWYADPVDSVTKTRAYEVLAEHQANFAGALKTHLTQLEFMLPTPLQFAASLRYGNWNDECGHFELVADMRSEPNGGNNG